MDTMSHDNGENIPSGPDHGGEESSVCSLSLSSLTPKAMLSQRIVNLEYYMCPPVKEFDNVYSDFRNAAVKRVPVIRIFGSTPAGQKMCANIHGVYPYISVLDDEGVAGLDHRIASALDNAINDSVAQNSSNKFQNQRGNFGPPAQHVFKVIRVVGKTFYGFRSNTEVFLRIYFYNPLILKKAVDVLQSGSILGRRFQPYEAHIPYNLQFMIDYGLYGMNFVHYASAKFRKNDASLRKEQRQCLHELLPTMSSQSSNSSVSSYIDPENIDERLLGPPELVKQTLCELEIDVIASDIILEINSSNSGRVARSVNPGIDSIWKDEIERRRQHGLDNSSQISIPSSQERTKVPLVHKTEDKYQQILWTKVENYFADRELEFESPPSPEKVSQGDDLLPSSQVLNHLSPKDRNIAQDAVSSQMTPEEDEFMMMLEEMAKETVPSEDNETNYSLSSSFRENPQESEENVEEDEVNTDEGDDAWEETLLSQSILQKISDAEAFYEEEVQAQERRENAAEEKREIVQIDGQGNDSDSSDESTSTRTSRRISLRRDKAAGTISTTSNSSSVRTSRKGADSKTKKPDTEVQPNQESEASENTSSRPRTRRSSSANCGGRNPYGVPKPKVKSMERLSLSQKRRKSRSLDSGKGKNEDDVSAPNVKSNSEPFNVKKCTEAEIEASLKPSSSNSASNFNTKAESKSTDVKTPLKMKEAVIKVERVTPKKIEPMSPPRTSSRISTRRSEATPSKEAVEENNSRLNNSDKLEILRRSPIVKLKKCDAPATPPPVTSKRERRIPARFLTDEVLDGPPFRRLSQGLSQSSQASTSQQKKEVNVKQKEESESKSEHSIEKVGESKISNERVDNVTFRKTRLTRASSSHSLSAGGPLEVAMKSTNEEDIKRKDVIGKGNTSKKSKEMPESQKKQDGSIIKTSNKEQKELLPTPEVEKASTIKLTRSRSFMERQKNEVEVTESKRSKKDEYVDSSKTRRGKETAKNGSEPPENTVSKKDVIQRCDSEQERESKSKKEILKKKLEGSNTKDPKQLGIRVGLSRGRSKKTMESESNTPTIDPSSASTVRSPAMPPASSIAAIVKARDLEVGQNVGVSSSSVNVASSNLLNVPLSSVAMSPALEKSFRDESSWTDPKTFKDAGSMCVPNAAAKMLQTEEVPMKSRYVQAESETATKDTQVPQKIYTTTSTQTEVFQKDIEIQTTAVPELCLCQCTCVMIPQRDVGVDSQNDLKPEMRNQRIQVDNVDMIQCARNSRFTTPQSNRGRSQTRTPTPLRSPEKRRLSRDSPIRRPRNIMTPCPTSRYLSALGMKTPSSGGINRWRGLGPMDASPQQQQQQILAPPGVDMSPYDTMGSTETNSSLTPPSRESRELYLTRIISSTSPSPKRKFSLRPRNLEIETSHFVKQMARSSTSNEMGDAFEQHFSASSVSALEVSQHEGIPSSQLVQNGNQEKTSAQVQILPSFTQMRQRAQNSGFEGGESVPSGGSYVDLSINSVYEFEENDSAENGLELVEPEVDAAISQQQQNQLESETDDAPRPIPVHVSRPLDLPLPPFYSQEETPRPCTPQSVTSNEDNASTPGSNSSQISLFQQKRIISRQRTKHRIERRKAANIEANRGVPDVFSYEIEPLKQPPSYKSVARWLDAARSTPGGMQKIKSTRSHGVAKDEEDYEEDKEDKWFREDSSSDEEEVPKAVKLFGGGGGTGSLSDNSDSDSDSSSASSADGLTIQAEEEVVKAFTPPTPMNISGGHDEFPIEQNSRQSLGQNGPTPTSILRGRKGRTPGSSRRLSGISTLKRKIRWEDETACQDGENENEHSIVSSKRLKLDDNDRKVNDGTSEAGARSSQESMSRTIDASELDGPSFKNALGLENSMSNFQDCKALHLCQFLTTMCIELHCSSRDGLTPDPQVDPILAIFIMVSSDYPEDFRRPREHLSLLVFEKDSSSSVNSEFDLFDRNQKMKVFGSEQAMIEAFVDLVRFWDPDIFVGFEVEKTSYGYLMQRGLHLGKDMAMELSRILPPPQSKTDKPAWRPKEEWNGMINGRIVLNLWRLLRHEIAVQSYTFENAAYHILRRRVYKFSWKTLDSYWAHKMSRHKVIQYYTIRIKGVVQIMEKLDLVNRTSELARLFGIQFYEVLSRGSQYRVESMMLRQSKPLNYIAPSPGVMQRARMRAPEYLPLIMEPRSSFYTDPVAVLDFQSLYPSMMIAYNYDYASCLGRVEHLGTTDPFPFGCLDLQVPPGDLAKLRENVHISPCGVAFLDKSTVRGIVPEMLEQILETRQMVKRAMKRWKNEGASLQKVLDSRQLGLKLIANVTYGYTSANFSGRMPCVDIADSIVSKGRETLQRAIDHVKENYDRWGGEVVYGDTDSMFVLFKGKSREEAFKSAYEIAEEVTLMNPKPVKLKFEKIYQPCILQSKKRYVGFAYESPEQAKPIYDAKGIETVRRDGCPAVRKILERTLHILFEKGKARVEEFVKLQFEKLFKGRVSMQDYIFAREFRGRAGYKPGACVPSLEIAKKLSADDPRAEPLISERVPYVIVYGDPKLPLIKLVRTPEEFMEDPSMRLNAHYYIEKVIIPALNRCLTMAKLDATKWYLDLPRKYLRNVLDQSQKKRMRGGGQSTLDDYVLHQNCLRCEGRAEVPKRGLCQTCLNDERGSALYLMETLSASRRKLNDCKEICKNCSGEENGKCVSIDCPILHKVTRYQRDQVYMKNVEQELAALEW